jgi:hypothetical protein
MRSRSGTLPIKLYGRVLYVYPKEFRKEFGDQMVAAFEEGYRDAGQSAHRSGFAIFWISILFDCLASAFAEHMASFWKDLRILCQSPGFRAAMVALLTIPFCTFGMVITGASGDTRWQRFIFVAGGCVQVGTFLAVSALTVFLIQRLFATRPIVKSPFLGRVRALQQMASTVLWFLALLLLGVLVFSHNLGQQPIAERHLAPQLLWWLVFPLLLLGVVGLFFMLEPVCLHRHHRSAPGGTRASV